jgi:thiamine-phosphate pyrophosphorylase
MRRRRSLRRPATASGGAAMSIMAGWIMTSGMTTRGTLADESRRRKPIRVGRRKLFPLVLMTDRERLPDPTAAAMRLPRGSAVILRDEGWAGRVALAVALYRICRARRLVFLVSGDERPALRWRAGGVHWPERRLRPRRKARRGFWVTAAAHGFAALVRARRAGADVVLVSPVFPTASHPGRECLGPVRFARLGARAGRPVFALGGIGPQSARRLRGSRCAGFAAIGALKPID